MPIIKIYFTKKYKNINNEKIIDDEGHSYK